MASVNPWPIKLKMVTVIKIAPPGNIASHQAPGNFLASDKSIPQVTVSSPIPNPKKSEILFKCAETLIAANKERADS